MALYVVVHHPGDPDRPWTNKWHDSSPLLHIITTTSKIGRLCEESAAKGVRVFVHRCG